MRYPNSCPYLTSQSSSESIPSTGIASKSICFPNASAAMIASLWAESVPFTSRVGSASASPLFCASFSASAYDSPCCVIAVRIELHVPLTIP